MLGTPIPVWHHQAGESVEVEASTLAEDYLIDEENFGTSPDCTRIPRL